MMGKISLMCECVIEREREREIEKRKGNEAARM
jgi:hypothetical protein